MFLLWYALPGAPNGVWLIVAAMTIATAAIAFAEVFNNAMLPTIESENKFGSLSGLGYGLGYFGGLVALIIFLIYYRPIFEFILKRVTKTKFFSKYSENISDSYEIVRNSTTPQISSISFGLSILYWVIISIAVHFILLSFGIDSINILKTISIYSSSVIIGAISFIPGGLGITEGSLIGLFSLEGIDISLALILSVMIRILTMWYSVSIGFICLKFTGGLSSSK